MASVNPERYHSLDALRGFAMFLGIVLHVGISFLTKPLPFWPVHDDQQTPTAEFMLFAIHNFRMQLFFLLVGFFGALLYARYGWRYTAMHRLKRIGLPLALAVPTIIATLQAVSIYCYAVALREGTLDTEKYAALMPTLAQPESSWGAVTLFFTNGQFLTYMMPGHLWFLWYLLALFATILPLAVVADRLRTSTIAQRWDRCWVWLFASRGRWLFLPFVAWLLLLPMTGPAGPDTPLRWRFDPAILAYYGFFVLVGWTLYRHRSQLNNFLGGWRFALVLGHVLWLPLAVITLFLAVDPDAGTSSPELFLLASQACSSLYCWCMIIGLMGLFQRYFAQPRGWIRYGSEASYWCYIASLPLIVWLQFVVRHWDIPADVKLVGVTIVSTLLLLASYHTCVRFTWIGRILNGPGPRQREANPARVEAEPVPVV